MPRPLSLRVVSALVVGGLALGGCSSEDEPAGEPTPSAGTPATSSAPASEAPAECTVAGFVPRTSIDLRRQRPVVVYAHRVSLAPASGMSSPDLDLNRADLVRLRVRPDDRSVELPAGVRRQVLASGGGPVEDGAIADTVRTRVRLFNDSRRNHSYLVYRAAFLQSGDWTIKACGAPYNDGTTVDTITGSYATLTRIRPVAVAQCGAPASSSELDAYAARFACRDF